jgi:hypothetical protein
MSAPPAPPEPEAIRLLEVQLIGEELHCALADNVDTLAPAEWGRALADLAGILAERLGQLEPHDSATVLRDIREAFVQELASPPGQEGPNG